MLRLSVVLSLALAPTLGIAQTPADCGLGLFKPRPYPRVLIEADVTLRHPSRDRLNVVMSGAVMRCVPGDFTRSYVCATIVRRNSVGYLSDEVFVFGVFRFGVAATDYRTISVGASAKRRCAADVLR